MEKKFIVQFIAQTTDITPLAVFGPFVEKKFAESFIKADIEAGHKFMEDHFRGYGRVCKFQDGYILPSYGEWKIIEMVNPLHQTAYPEHASAF